MFILIKFKQKTMESKKLLVSLVAMFALLLLVTNVSAFAASINSVEVNGVEDNQQSFAVFAGQTIPVRVIFTANGLGLNEAAEDVRIKARITGENDFSVSTERFDIVGKKTYSRLLAVEVPFDLDDELNEGLTLVITVENRDGFIAEPYEVDLEVQRESFLVEVLDVAMDPNVKAGENLVLDIVLKNRGRHEAEDTFVKVRIPALGIERKAFFGDLSPVDQGGLVADKEDSVERRMFVSIPRNAPAGVYSVELEAFNSDSSTTMTRKVAVVGASEDSMIVSAVSSKTFAVGESKDYGLTLVNTGSTVRIYELVLDAPTGLTVEAEEPIVVVPAGSSKAVKVTASAEKAGQYDFAVNVMSDSELVKKQEFRANVQGGAIRGGAGNATVLLTVVLAIIFVVLLVVLIVLLTRKPEKAEEFGESYY